ncbi:MAG: hypothetical protein LUE97_01495 [Oscillospiraceae bacterium]|nr:hypothetical protein [Oscillospiraceae bacterium]MCD8065964.1 hypothetical protein [Oscillospiraceae bacterium]
MRGRPPGACWLSLVFIALGTIIILTMVLPSGVWWFMFGAGLIAVGIMLCRRL